MSNNLESVMAKVRKALALAQHPDTPPREAAQAQAMADALMLKYAIDSITADAGKPPEQRSKAIMRRIDIGQPFDGDYYIRQLAHELARHTRCKVRIALEFNEGYGWYAKLYGFESDVLYFEMMFANLRLHMLGVLLPKYDKSSSVEDNCYRLHNLGYNWLEIAELDGWHKMSSIEDGYYGIKVPYKHEDGRAEPATKVGSHYKRAYLRAVAERGEQHQKIPAGGSKTFRESAASGYSSRIGQRLREVEGGRGVGTAVILRSRMQDIEDLFREDNPDLFTKRPAIPTTEPPARVRKVRQRKYVPPPFSAAGYSAGVQHANKADLGSTKMGEANRKAI